MVQFGNAAPPVSFKKVKLQKMSFISSHLRTFLWKLEDPVLRKMIHQVGQIKPTVSVVWFCFGRKANFPRLGEGFYLGFDFVIVFNIFWGFHGVINNYSIEMSVSFTWLQRVLTHITVTLGQLDFTHSLTHLLLGKCSARHVAFVARNVKAHLVQVPKRFPCHRRALSAGSPRGGGPSAAAAGQRSRFGAALC